MTIRTPGTPALEGKLTKIDGGTLLEGACVEIPITKPIRYYRHGWQSWSLTAWIDPNRPNRPINPKIIRPQADDPVHIEQRNWGGSWLGAAEMSDGQVWLLGGLDLESHVEYNGKSLIGTYESGSGDWFLGIGTEEEVFARYAELLAEKFGKGRDLPKPRVWCSWYSLYTDIDEKRILKILNGVGGLPFDVFQIDDGWQKGIGDWEANEKFPLGMGALADHIKATGRKAGLWLAPLLVLPSTPVFKEHSDWLLHDDRGTLISAGHNWGEPMYALDTTHPDAQAWLAGLMKKVRAWGYDYLKLDFLYAGALPGKRYKGISREKAFREGLGVLREAMGDAYLLSCGTPIVPSIGLCDAMRVGPDVAAHWHSFTESTLMNNHGTPGTWNAIRTTLNRLWLSPLAHLDPDVAYFRSKNNFMTSEQTQLLQDLVEITGFKATSDLPEWLTPEERSALDAFLKNNKPIEKLSRYGYATGGRAIDFAQAASLPELLPKWQTTLGAQAASSPFVLDLYERLAGFINHLLIKG